MKKNQKSWSTNEMKNGLFNHENIISNFRTNKKLIKISAKVTGRKLIDNGKYTEYNIFISTEFNEWNIQKRYSEFDALNQSLIRKIPEINQYFPPKRFFKNSEETIDERVKYFNTYLHKLFNNYDIFLFDEVIDFISIDKKILELAISKHTMGNKDKENQPIYDSVKKSIAHLTKNEKFSSFDDNEEQKDINILENKIKSNENLSRKRKESTISSNLNINLEINAKNNNDNISKNNTNTYNTEDFEENSTNYFSSLLEYESSKKSSEDLSNESPLNKIVEELLKNLNQKNDNKTAIIKSFEEFLKKDNTWPDFSQNQIIKLYTGVKNYKNLNGKNKEKGNQNSQNESTVRRAVTSKIINGKIQKNNKNVRKSFGRQTINDNDSLSYSDCPSSESDDDSDDINRNDNTNNLYGLFALIGNYEKNELLAANCLDLLVKLLSKEYNPIADFYVDIFKKRRLLDYNSMKLDDIIRSNIGGAKSVLNAMKILYILFKDNLRFDKHKEEIVKNEVALKKYQIFEKNYYQ